MRAFVGPVLIAASLVATFSQQARPPLQLQRVTLHAHNCFPEDGQWTDRLDRALATGVRPLAIEQDLVWFVDPADGADGEGRSVLSHGGELTGTEPSLEEYFFTRMRPIMERALAENRRHTWPLVFLHFNFRNNDSAHLQYVWQLLDRHRSWLTTAERGENEAIVHPLALGPMMVLTEAGQDAIFYDRVPVGDRLLVFGAQASTVAIPHPATNYRRWINFPWSVVEPGGQQTADDWTADDAARLRGFVDRAHSMGLWIRFYTLNGHRPDENQGWSAGYNFGSLEAVQLRWRAAIDAGVDFIATDQYELLAGMLKP